MAEFALIAAVVPRLKAWPALAEIVAGRVYDAAPRSAAFPYLTLGPVDATTVDVDCIPALEIGIQIDGWSRRDESASMAEGYRLAAAIRGALDDAELDLGGGSALALMRHELTRVMRDPDGVTVHAVVQFTAIVEAT